MNTRVTVFAVVVPLVALLGTSAHAETRRARIALVDLPRSDVVTKIAASDAKLPDGAREGAPAPKAWGLGGNDGDSQPFHCTDGRRASVTPNGPSVADTDKIWERDGRTFIDHASIEVKDGRVHVTEATRREMKMIVDGAWAYRENDFVTIVSARDSGRFDAKWAFFGCKLEELLLPLTPHAATTASSPDEANAARIGLLQSSYPRGPTYQRPWQGVAYQLLASVSKSSADRAMMLNVVMIDR